MNSAWDAFEHSDQDKKKHSDVKKLNHYKVFICYDLLIQCYGFSSVHVWMWELGYKESWHQRTDAFELWC